ncbi:unnamed protein product, partial [Staurois parvus]
VREGWRTLNGGKWRDLQRGVEDTEWRPVEGLAERGGGHLMEASGGEWRPVEGLAERGGGHLREASGGICREGWRTSMSLAAIADQLVRCKSLAAVTDRSVRCMSLAAV